MSHTLKISKPVSFLFKEIKVDPKGLFKNIAKFISNISLQNGSGAFENIIDIPDNLGFNQKPENLAWLLISRSIEKTFCSLMKESQDLFKKKEIQGIAEAELLKRLNNIKIDIDYEFFDRPQDALFLEELGGVFNQWLIYLGLSEVQARAIVMKMPSRFVLELHVEWCEHYEKYEPIIASVNSPFVKADREERAWNSYHVSLCDQVNKRMFNEALSLNQVYVPLNAYYIKKAKDRRKSRQHSESRVEERFVVNLHDELKSCVLGDSGSNVRLISGGPGSGKSSFTKMFAAHLAAEGIVNVLYIPLHLFDPSGDLIKAVEIFSEQNMYLHGSPIDVKNGKKNLLVIFDGLDELAMSGKLSEIVAREFVDEVINKFNYFSSNRLNRKALISGRELVIQSSESRLREEGQIVHLLPFFHNENEIEQFYDKSNLLKVDLRQEWWGKYASSSGKDYKSMPKVLEKDNLFEITRQPLLNYLVALSYERGKLDFGKDTTLNEIYNDLLGAVYERKYSATGVHPTIRGMKDSRFFRVLEEIAVAIWHGDGRTASIKYIEKHCVAAGLKRYLDEFTESAQSGVTTLLTAFYFRKSSKMDFDGEKTFEFTHKSFGEYLTSRRLMIMMEKIDKELCRYQECPDDGWDIPMALDHWTEICSPTSIDIYLFEFIKKEVAIREIDIVKKWQKNIILLIELTLSSGVPIDKIEQRNFNTMLEQVRNVETALLAMHYACALVTKKVSSIKWPSYTSFGSWIKRLKGQKMIKDRDLFQRCLGYLNFDKCILCANDFGGCDLSYSSMSYCSMHFSIFVEAVMRNVNLYNAILLGANFFRADMANANFKNAKLNRTIFWGANLEKITLTNAQLEHADMRGANLDGAIIRNANLRKSILIKARLRGVDLQSACLNNSDLSGVLLCRADLRWTDLQGANLEGANLEEANLEGANLTGANFKGAKLDGANLKEVRGFRK